MILSIFELADRIVDLSLNYLQYLESNFCSINGFEIISKIWLKIENIHILKSINELYISLYAEMFWLSMFVYKTKKESIQEKSLVPNPS